MNTVSTTTHYPAATVSQQVETHTLSVLVDNEPGVLARVIGLFSGRGYNIDSLTVSETEHEKHLSRITIVTRGTPMVIEQIKNQLDRLVPVHRVVDMTVAGPHLERELAMVKVRGKGEHRMEALAAGRRLPRPRDRRLDRELRVRDHRRQRQDRELRRADDPARPGRGLAHRRRRDRARAGGDVSRDCAATSGPIPKFASTCGTFGCELRNLGTTSNFIDSSAVLNLKFL